jgi:type II secretory pathway pseudopilin PulG
MIKFFRKTRQNMIKENKVSKYMLYAIGEIVLVVIGILIALSINNWNENRRLQNEELKLLFDLKTNLETTYKNFINDTIDNSESVAKYNNIKRFINKDLPYSNKLDKAFGEFTFWSSPYIITTAYKTLQTKGLDIIKNQQLKKDIVNIYDVHFNVLTQDYDKAEWGFNQTVVTPFFAKHIRRYDDASLSVAKPNNFENLKQNDEFLNILSMLIRQRKRGLEFYREVMNVINKLIYDIETEINLRTN